MRDGVFVVLFASVTAMGSGGTLRSVYNGLCLSGHWAEGKDQLRFTERTECHADGPWYWQENFLKVKLWKERCLTCRGENVTLSRCSGFFNQQWYVDNGRLVCSNQQLFSDVSSSNCLHVADSEHKNFLLLQACLPGIRQQWSGSVIDEAPGKPTNSRVFADSVSVVFIACGCACFSICCYLHWYAASNHTLASSSSVQNSASRSVSFLKRHCVWSNTAKYSASQLNRKDCCTNCGDFFLGATHCPSCGQSTTVSILHACTSLHDSGIDSSHCESFDVSLTRRASATKIEVQELEHLGSLRESVAGSSVRASGRQMCSTTRSANSASIGCAMLEDDLQRPVIEL